MFYIGDKVRIKTLDEISEDRITDRTRGDRTAWTKRKVETAGETGVIVDKMYSEATDINLYSVQIDGNGFVSAHFYCEDDLTPYVEEEEVGYATETRILEKVVVGIIYEVRGDEYIEVTRGHGHIIHEGAFGIAQATSYAFKKAWEKMNGGNI